VPEGSTSTREGISTASRPTMSSKSAMFLWFAGPRRRCARYELTRRARRVRARRRCRPRHNVGQFDDDRRQQQDADPGRLSRGE
jgi:hypothetical protein